MNLFTALTVYSSGTSEGVKKGWDSRGRGRAPKLSAPHDTSKTVSVDFDNTLAEHKPGEYDQALGKPLPHGLELLHELKNQGFVVHILTARPQIPEVQKWLDDHGVGFAKASNTKLPSTAYIDDRAVNWTGHKTVEEAMKQVNSLSELRKSQVKQGMDRIAKAGKKK